MHAKEHAEFTTVTCLEWKHILKEDRFKDIIIDSLSFLSKVPFTPYAFYLGVTYNSLQKINKQ